MDKIFGTEEFSPVINGEKYRRTHKGSVIGILGADAPPVASRGGQFYNVDRWTARLLVNEMCEWAGENPGCVPTRAVVTAWVQKVNATPSPGREIVIAETPDELPLRTALALTGGGYHEALHTLYSMRGDLKVDEVASIILPRWAQVKDWSKLTKALLDWSNIVEDIRIERRGCERFEGIHVKMCDLQDFILSQEAAIDQKNRNAPDAMSVIARSFRDYGLGYNTEKQRDALAKYKAWNAEALALVKAGPFRPLLDEAMKLSEADDLGALRIALDVLVKLGELQGQQDSKQEAKDGQAGDGKNDCPKCGADASHLVVRPKADSKGSMIPGKGIATCTKCGFQQEVDVRPKSASSQKNQKDKGEKPQPTPKFEGFDEKQKPETGKGGKSGEKPEKSDKGDSKKETGEKGEKNEKPESKAGDSKGEDKSAESKPEKPEAGEPGDKSEGEKDTDDGEGDNADGEGEDGQQDDAGSASSSGKGGEGKDGDTQPSKENGGRGAGGHHDDQTPTNNDWSQLAQNALNAGNKDINKLDGNSALAQAVGQAIKQADSDTKMGEKPWRPASTDYDKAAPVNGSYWGRTQDVQNADIIIDSVKAEVAYLRSRLRTIIRSMEQTRRVHGVRKGRTLSGRYLVDSKATIKSGQVPTRAYTTRGTQIDMTMAAAVVMDESGSMCSHLETATRIMTAIVEPLDALGFPTLALGIRDGEGGRTPSVEGVKCHRTEGVRYDIFKLWGETFRAVRHRFPNTKAQGGTPLADGIQYALKAISGRNEAHRFIFVVTDGEPNHEHRPVIKRQIRLAQEAGITVIGVGIGKGTEGVMKLFPESVWTGEFSEFPKLLLKKINDHVDVMASKRGTRLRDAG